MNPNSAPPPSPEEDFQLIDFQLIRNRVGFVVHSARRHPLRAVLSFLVAFAAGAAAVSALPRTYHVDTELLAQRNVMLPALSNPGRAVRVEDDVPTRAAAEAVLRRDNLVSLMKQTDLLAKWEANRPLLLRLRDRILQLVQATPSEEDRASAMIGFLESRINVSTSENTITIGIDWPDAELAYRLTEAAQQNFLEQRHTAEVSSVAEAITILEGHAGELRDAIGSAMADLNQVKETTGSRSRAATPSLVRRDPAHEARRTEAAEVKTLRDAKRRAISELEEFRSRRLAELQTELTQKRAVFADAHPAILAIQTSISALQEESPQLTTLRREEKSLAAEYDALTAAANSATPRPVETAAKPRAPETSSQEVNGEYARTRLRFAMEKYDALMERIDAARIELDTARAAFKYRYNVIRPPTFPRRPAKPKVPLLLAVVFVAAVGFSFLSCAWADLRSRRLIESWQIHQYLDLEVLGTVPRT